MCKTRPTLRKTVVNFQNKTEKTLKASGKEKKKHYQPNKTENPIEIRCVDWQSPGLEGKGSVSGEKLLWIRNSLLRPIVIQFHSEGKIGTNKDPERAPRDPKVFAKLTLAYCQAWLGAKLDSYGAQHSVGQKLSPGSKS